MQWLSATDLRCFGFGASSMPDQLCNPLVFAFVRGVRLKRSFHRHYFATSAHYIENIVYQRHSITIANDCFRHIKARKPNEWWPSADLLVALAAPKSCRSHCGVERRRRSTQLSLACVESPTTSLLYKVYRSSTKLA